MNKYLIYDNKTLSMNVITQKENKGFLKFAYKNINCELIEFSSLTPSIDIVADEEGLLRNPIDINYIYDKETERVIFLTGKILFVGFDNGNITGLTDEQIDYIKQNVRIDTIPMNIFKALS